MNRVVVAVAAIAVSLLLVACSGQASNENSPRTNSSQNGAVQQQTPENREPESGKEQSVLKLTINNEVVPVVWEDNAAVSALSEQVAEAPITVQMSMYGGNEQVGSLGRSYPTANEQTTTHCGDVVLYSGSNIVVFYGSNDWSYTRLGKMDLQDSQVRDLLSNGDVTLVLSGK